MENQSIWLDLELRKDIDDFVTLIYALENKMPVSVVSIHNPSESELKLLGSTLKVIDTKPYIVITGDVTEYEEGEDLTPTLMAMVKGVETPVATPLKSFIDSENFPSATRIFCGGSLTTLATLLTEKPDVFWDAYIQGGYAGPALMGSNALKKFRKRAAVPTWNLNLDIEASDVVLAAKNVKRHFISKDICHDSWVHDDDVKNGTSMVAKLIRTFFDNNNDKAEGAFDKKKCMHDLLAFLSMSNKELVEFKEAALVRDNSPRVKWHCETGGESNCVISVAYDKSAFLEML
jgi:inosine-uridine nucleoside N-ribohydrolase